MARLARKRDVVHLTCTCRCREHAKRRSRAGPARSRRRERSNWSVRNRLPSSATRSDLRSTERSQSRTSHPVGCTRPAPVRPSTFPPLRRVGGSQPYTASGCGTPPCPAGCSRPHRSAVHPCTLHQSPSNHEARSRPSSEGPPAYLVRSREGAGGWARAEAGGTDDRLHDIAECSLVDPTAVSIGPLSTSPPAGTFPLRGRGGSVLSTRCCGLCGRRP